MTLAESLLLDFEPEAVNTRRALERVPADHASWKPHNKSMSLGSIAGHIAGLPAFGHLILTTPSLNMGVDPFPKYTFTTPEAAVEHAAGSAAEIRIAFASLSDQDLLTPWTLSFHDHVIATAPRAVLFRTMFFNHLIHHRGQLNVYLRMLDIPVPGLYGPSADEPFVPQA